MRRRARAVGWIVMGAGLAAFAAGCAPIAAMQPPPKGGGAGSTARPAESPPSSRPSEATPPSRAGVARTAAPDTVPSADAERVLATIPEPLPPAQRTSPPVFATERDRPRGDSGAASPPAGADSSRRAVAAGDSAGVDSAGQNVPIPEPTAPLGERPGALSRILSDSTATDSAAAPSATPSKPGASGATPPPGATPPRSAGAAPAGVAKAECFRLQIGAPADSRKAEGLRKAAASQLDLAFDVVHTHGLYKVRSHECLNREAVDHLRARAVSAGFRGVFAVKE